MTQLQKKALMKRFSAEVQYGEDVKGYTTPGARFTAVRAQRIQPGPQGQPGPFVTMMSMQASGFGYKGAADHQYRAERLATFFADQYKVDEQFMVGGDLNTHLHNHLEQKLISELKKKNKQQLQIPYNVTLGNSSNGMGGKPQYTIDAIVTIGTK